MTPKAVEDPNSNLNRKLEEARKTMSDNAKVIDAYMAKGMSREQAWAEALKA